MLASVSPCYHRRPGVGDEGCSRSVRRPRPCRWIGSPVALKECSKSIPRRLHDSNFVRKYFVGRGIDIGGYPDPLALYLELFPLALSIRTFDRADGDAQYLEGVSDETYDFVHSSHCLEHLVDPREGISNWMRVLKPGGHLVFTVPDEDLYEQGEFPSTFNSDHKWTFTIFKSASWSDRSINLAELVCELGPDSSVERIDRLTETYRFDLPRYDQTLTPISESAIECVVRKRLPEEVEARGRLPGASSIEKRLVPYYNQYQDDLDSLKSANHSKPPFGNDSDI